MARVGNWPLMTQVVEQIIQHPETWQQSSWVSECGTKFCVAGWACTLSGYKTKQYSLSEPFPMPSYRFVLPRKAQVSVVAAELLGIEWNIRFTPNYSVAPGVLFVAGNSLQDILELISAWAEEDGIELSPVISAQLQIERGELVIPDSVEITQSDYVLV